MTTTASLSPDPLGSALVAALGAQYEIVRLLGRGGMGAVYLARERLLERLVAIKVLPHADAQGDSRERFLREARIVAQLTHPHIAPLHGIGEAGGTLFFVMGYIHGESLEAVLRREGRLPPERARRVLTEIADALAYAHSHGIVHRDIKPDNVLIEDGTGRAVLTDFGIAKRLAAGETLTQAGLAVGTPLYMSPEQASGERSLDGRSDVYSLGVLGYRMLAGRPPFEGSVQEILAQHVTRTPTPLGVLGPELPPPLVQAVQRCLEKDPDQRWAEAGELRAALAGDAPDAALVPEELENLPSVAWWGGGVLLATAATAVVARPTVAGHTDVTLLGFPLYVLFGAGFVGVMLVRARRAGMPWSLALRIASWPPRRWTLWWPRHLRRPQDFWSRLPPFVRAARTVMTAWTAALVVASVGMVAAVFAPNGYYTERQFLILLGASALLSMPLPLVPVVGVLWGRRHRLRMSESIRLLAGEPSLPSPFWRRPRVARLLAGDASAGASNHAPTLAAPTTPAELLASIEALGRELRPVMREICDDAAIAARQARSRLDSLEREIATLARTADPAEIARLDRRLTDLGTDTAGDDEGTRQVRAVLEQQRALLRTLQDRVAATEARRRQLVDLLRTLWLQLATLRAEAAHQSLDASDATSRVRLVCDDIARHADAMAVVEALTAG